MMPKFQPTRAERRLGPWYMKPVCRNDEGTSTGCEFRWFAKPFRTWVFR